MQDCENNVGLVIAWTKGTLARQSAHEQDEAVASQIEDTTGLSFAEFAVPDCQGGWEGKRACIAERMLHKHRRFIARASFASTRPVHM